MTINKKIIVIEDQESWRNHFHTILKQIGEKRDVIKIGVVNDFFEKYNSVCNFDDVDFCFVDLELGPSINELTDDIWGLEKVLPHIRNLAPWIPTACISRFISGHPEIIGKLSVSDFDAFYPKEIISIFEKGEARTHPEFNSKGWENILSEMMMKRVASMTGRSVDYTKSLLKNSNNLEFILSDSVKNKLSESELKIFKEGIILMGFGGSKLSIDEIITGFSGVNVAKVGIYGEDSKGKIRSHWLMKWGSSIRKLAKEVSAHELMFRRGFDRRIQVPQLYNNVLCWNGFGFIAYAFEEEAQTALEFVKQQGIDSFKLHLEKIAKSLYSKATSNPISPSVQLGKWCGLDIDKQNIISKNTLNNNFEVTEALIHGDFHLRNILVKNEYPTLIDFAKSDIGPVAIDLAKLVVDIFVFCNLPEIESKDFKLGWDYLTEKSVLSGILEVYEKYLTARDDKLFFEMAIKAYVSKYITYSDVSEMKTIKTSLERLLGKAI